LLLLFLGAMLPAVQIPGANHQAPMKVVPSVDLTCYAGKCYEIARLTNCFQRDCASDTTAFYALRPDSKITVVNACRTSEGRVKSASPQHPPAETLPIKASDDRGVVRMRVAWGVFPGQAGAPEPALAQELNER
jgi:hypothetical protein